MTQALVLTDYDYRCDSQDLPEFITTSWDRKVWTHFSFYYWKSSTELYGLPAEEVEDYVKKRLCSHNDQGRCLYLEKEYENVLQGKRSEKEILLDKNGRWEKVVDVSKVQREKTSLSIDFQKEWKISLLRLF